MGRRIAAEDIAGTTLLTIDTDGDWLVGGDHGRAVEVVWNLAQHRQAAVTAEGLVVDRRCMSDTHKYVLPFSVKTIMVERYDSLTQVG